MDSYSIQLTGQLLLAVFLGGLIGVERWFRRKPAGLRTYSLVALGACLFTSISLSGVFSYGSFDPSRVISQIVVGVGFLGAGIIFTQGNLVQGLTTAAGLWVTAAIGATVGAGFYMVAIIATIISLLIFFVLFFFERYIPQYRGDDDENP